MHPDANLPLKSDGDRPMGKTRSLRFPVEIEDVLMQHSDWKEFIVEAVREKNTFR